MSAFDAAAGTLETTAILRWYARDFGGADAARARVARALGLEAGAVAGARLGYRAYDWTSTV